MTGERQVFYLTILGTIITWTLCASTQAVSDDQNSERTNSSIVEDFAHQLLAQYDSVFTAEIHVSILTAFGHPSGLVLPESELQSFFHEELHVLSTGGADDAEIQDAMVQFAARVGLSHNGWIDLSIVQDGDKIRNDFAAGSEARRSYVRSPTSDLNYSGTSGTTTLRLGQSRLKMYQIKDVRFLPSKLTLTKLSLDSDLQISEEGVYILTKEPWLELEFDPQSAFIYRGRIAPRGSTSFTEYYQFGPSEIDDGLLLPRVSCMCKGRTVSEGKVAIQMLRVFLLRNATVNAPVSESSFAVDAPAGTRVYVAGDDGEKLLAAKLARDVSDVHAYLNRVVDAKTPEGRTGPERRSRVSLLLYVNAVAILIAVALLLLRRRLTAKRSQE